jgi:cytochrome oxidase Cu insertion factor (SCO1/SenC/PrrC family)
MNLAATANRRSAAEVAADIVSIRRSPARRNELVAMLAEQSPLYRHLGSGDAERIRGFVLASFETVGLPETALPFVLEELETGLNPYTVAAAAKAIRGARQISDQTFALLVGAARRIENNDDNVQFDSIDPGDRVATRSSALAEIVRTIGAAGARPRQTWQAIEAMAARGNLAPEAMAAIEHACRELSKDAPEQCCCGPSPRATTVQASPAASCDVDDLVLEDQSGAVFKYGDFFQGRPSVATFFYTRCMNPRKCSLTVSKLAGLQRRLFEAGLGSRINVGAFTYDPDYDRPDRLQRYGLDRGFRFDDRNRFIRTAGSFEPIRTKFDLSVGFGPATVNRHSVELMILDASGETVRQFRRVQWSETEVLEAIRETLDAKDAR